MPTQYAGYDIGCTIDSRPVMVPRYIGDESGLPVTVISRPYIALSAPSQTMLNAGSTTLVYYSVNSVGQIHTLDGVVSPDALPAVGTQLDIGMVAGYADAPPPNAVVATIMIGAIPLIAYLICLAIIVAATAAVFVSKYYTEAWKVKYQTEAAAAYQDYLLKAEAVVSDDCQDVSSPPDGVCDVRTVKWANGKVMRFALNETGTAFLGGKTYDTPDPGTTAEPPPGCDWGFLCDLNDIELMILLGGGIVLGIVVLPKILDLFHQEVIYR